MTRRVSVAELLTSITLLPVEAIAIVQQLIHGRAPVTLLAPLGPPTAETVFVGADGSVNCDTCDAPFAVSDLATLLESMLPVVQSGNALSIGVPGALRYTLARARLEVDAPPFDSVGDFSRALARHECGDRTAVIQRVIGRANGTGAAPRLDRRRADPAVTQLRRQLRAADARVFDQQRAIDALSAMPTRVPAKGKGLALAAGVAIGLITFGAGEMMRHDPVGAAAAVIDEPTAISQPAPARVVAEPTPRPAAVAPRASTPEARTPKRVLRNVSTPAREAERPGRFRWLKTHIVLRHDPL